MFSFFAPDGRISVHSHKQTVQMNASQFSKLKQSIGELEVVLVRTNHDIYINILQLMGTLKILKRIQTHSLQYFLHHKSILVNSMCRHADLMVLDNLISN